MIAIDVAVGKMRIVKERMLGKYPLHAAVIARSSMQPEGVGTMAVTIRDGQLTFLFDPRFVLAQPLDVLVGGLLHEVGHVVFDHLTTDPARFPDRHARTIAEEVTVNELISEPLPDGVLRIDAYGLPPDEDTDTRYERLASQKTSAQRPKSGKAATRKGASARKKRGAETKKSGGNEENSAPPATFDDHSAWAEVTDIPSGRQILDQILAAAAADVPSEAWPNVDARIRERICAAQHRGSRVDAIAVGMASINWPHVLAPITARRVTATADFRRPSRRFPALIGIVPAFRRESRALEVLAVIDTSGSIAAADLAAISAEIAIIARKNRVTVVQCDNAIRSVARYSGTIKRAHGRGGTSFFPPLEPAFLASHRADVVLYFTDGAGPAPTQPPRVPVVWVLSEDATPPALWGRVVRRRNLP